MIVITTKSTQYNGVDVFFVSIGKFVLVREVRGV